MKSLIEQILNLSKQFVQGKHVFIQPEKISELAKLIKNYKWSVTPKQSNRLDYYLRDQIFEVIVFNSINYCYWYGSCDVKPLSARNLRKIIDDYDGGLFDSLVSDIKQELIDYNIPYLSSRLRNLDEIERNKDVFFSRLINCTDDVFNVESFLNLLVTTFPNSFADDPFKKRALLVLHEMYRNKEIAFDKSISTLPVPADYRLPQVLVDKSCIKYSEQLQKIIDNEELIPSGSNMECEIRSATILVCDELARQSGVDTSLIDEYLWDDSRFCTSNFHLTVTEHY